mgnify:CR=1 FL=1
MSDVATLGAPAIPTGAGTVTLFDSTADIGKGTTLTRRKAYAHIDRLTCSVFCDDAVTVRLESLAAGSTSWRAVVTDAVPASTRYASDFKVGHLFDDFRLTIDVADAPAIWEITARLIAGDRSAGI